MFPSLHWQEIDLTGLRQAKTVSKGFNKRAHKRLPGLRFLLDAGVPVHTVAARCGHDPATLLRSYAKRTKKADSSAAAVIGAMSKTALE